MIFISRELIDDMNSVPEICPKHKCAMYWYGDWYCSKCQQEEEMLYQEAECRYYNSFSKCLPCGNYDDEWCSHYKMPMSMCGRKYKCKHFVEPNYNDSSWW